MMVDLVNSLILVALGFAPTYIAMEAAWKMGKIIGKRGVEKTAAATTTTTTTSSWRSA
jgi:hypothetical protein